MSQPPGLAKDLRLPFDLYDFFGYLFPGTFFGFGSYILLRLNQSAGISPEEILNRFSEFKGELSFGIGFFLLFILLVILYLLGHVVGSLGSLILEKYLVKNIMGYPSEYYLRLREGKAPTLSEVFYKWIFVCSLLTLVVGVLAIDYNGLVPVFKVLLIWVGVLFISRILILLRREIWILPAKMAQGESAPAYLSWVKWRTRITKQLARPTYYLIDLPSKVLFASTGVLSPFDSQFVEKFNSKFENEFKIRFAESGTNGFWLCYVKVVKDMPSSLPVIKNFLHMYSFARNMSAACFLLVVFQLFLTFVLDVGHATENWPYILGLNLSFWLIGVLMLLRYFYIYASYYTKFLFRAYLVSE